MIDGVLMIRKDICLHIMKQNKKVHLRWLMPRILSAAFQTLSMHAFSEKTAHDAYGARDTEIKRNRATTHIHSYTLMLLGFESPCTIADTKCKDDKTQHMCKMIVCRPTLSIILPDEVKS